MPRPIRTGHEAEQLARRDPRVAAALGPRPAPLLSFGQLVDRVAAFALVELYRLGYRCGWDGVRAAAQLACQAGCRFSGVGVMAARSDDWLRGFADATAEGLVDGGHATPEDGAP